MCISYTIYCEPEGSIYSWLWVRLNADKVSSYWVLPIHIEYGKFPYGLLAAENWLGLSPLAFSFGHSPLGLLLLACAFWLGPLAYCIPAWLSALPFPLAGIWPFLAFGLCAFIPLLVSTLGPIDLLLPCLWPRLTPIRVTRCIGTLEG